MESRIGARTFDVLRRPIAAGARVRIERVNVGDTVVTLDLERFEVWAPDAEILVEHGGGRRERIAPPPVQYFRGTIDGEPDSMVFVAIRSDGAVEGMVLAHERRYRMRSRNAEEMDVFVAETGIEEEMPPDGGFACDLEQQVLTAEPGLPSVRSDGAIAANALGGGAVTANGALSGTGTWTLNLAIETDYELYTDLGSNAANVSTFIGNLVGQASVIYQRDLTTDLLISFSRVQTSSSDPFTVDPGASGTWNGSPATYTTQHALAELGDLWANAGTRPFGGARSSVILVSGKNQTAGVAWTARSCQGDFACSGGNCGSAIFDGHTGGAYAYLGLGNQSTTAVPNPNNTNNGVLYGLPSSNYWALLGFAHELGHNIDGPHTHCLQLTAAQKTQYGVTRNAVDECVNGCYGPATGVPPEKGTIMSYCHMLGSSQSRFVFGRSLEPSELMVNRIRTYINSRTPASPAISAPSSLGPGASSTASIVSPVAGVSYAWTITNGTINGPSSGTSISFTATSNPVTLRVRGTNSSGCSASDYRNVTVTSCTAPSIASITQSQNIAAGGSVQLSATATGSGPFTYQWYVGTSGNTTVPAAPGNPISAAPGTSTTYWVRVTGACGTTDSPTVTIGVLPAATPSSLYVLTPCRVLDTRGGPALASGSTRVTQVTGACGVPAGAKAVVANITAPAPTSTGFLSCYPAGLAWPGSSTLSYRSGKTRATSAILMLSSDGRVSTLNSGAAQHYIIDVTGYFE